MPVDVPKQDCVLPLRPAHGTDGGGLCEAWPQDALVRGGMTIEMDGKLPRWALGGLGLTQIVGYGTLYYAFSILVPDIARDLGRSEQWVFGAFSLALLAGGLAAPVAGRLADRFGAARLMAIGTVGASASLLLLAAVPGPLTFALALAVSQVIAGAVLYAMAFTAIVQTGGASAQTSIVHLTLIAGFASTIFWPFTSWLHGVLSWREVYILFAGLNIVLCLPVHLALARLATDTRHKHAPAEASRSDDARESGTSLVFVLMLLGFAIEGYALSAMLVHMVPLTQALGLGAAGLLISSLFGPAQVTSRLVNLVFGRSLSQVWLAVIASVLLPIGLAILITTSPWIGGAVLFAICMGLGSGLTSIVGGTLPLELFGRQGYGTRLGWSNAAKQLTSAVAPFAMSLSMAGIGIPASLWTIAAAGLAGAVLFVAIAFVTGRWPGR